MYIFKTIKEKKTIYNVYKTYNQMKKKQLKENKPSSNKQISSATKLPIINNKKASSSTLSQNLVLNTSSYQDDGLITLIQQYLIKNNLFQTLDYFQRDCLKGFKQSVKSIDVLKKQLIEAFDSGNRDVFFQKFSQYVPLSMRAKDSKTLKMQFYIQLYFFIYCTHPYLGKKKTIDSISKQSFISYLQGRGSILAKQQQFLPFYALAYLQKPQQHQNFKQMFTRKWVQDLRKQVNLYLQKLYPLTKTPTIVTMYDKFIEYNLQGDKFSSVALTEPDEQDYNPIQEQIQENLEQSIMNNPQPILHQNNSHKVMNNNSLEKYHSIKGNNSGKVNHNQSYNNREKQQFIDENNKQQLISNQLQRQQLIQNRQKIIELQQQRDRLHQLLENFKNKYQNLQNDFKQYSEEIKNVLQQSQIKWFKIIQQLYAIGTDLLDAAGILQKQKVLPDPQLLAKKAEKLQRYKGFVNMNIEDLLSDNVADYSVFQRPEHDVSIDAVKKNAEYYQRDQKLIEIDFQKIKAVLSTVPSKDMLQEAVKQIYLQKCLILQALRWRMTRIRGAFQKRQVVLSYITYDVLGINQGKRTNKKDTIINILLDSQNQMILLQTTLFISALSKDYYGRQYLFDQNMMKKMMELRKKPEVDQRIKCIILIVFQLQSNKRSCQTVMVDNGLLEQIVQKLDKQRDQMTIYIMEYATALLLNLLLSKKGLDRAEPIKSQILMALINLMQTQNSSVKSFVHACLYPLLSRRVFRQKALQFGMQQNIKFLLQNNPSIQSQHQLRYVYTRLMMQHDQQDDKDEQPQFDQINDEEIGDDTQFIIEEISSSLSGQFLLMKKYPLTGPDAMKQMGQVKQAVRETFSKAIYYDRQVTQRMSIQTPLLGKGRKSQINPDKGGFTHNNSVYSNKSSNRILRSQKNSRIKNPQTNKTAAKQRLDTVHQNGSQASLKQYRQQSRQNSKQDYRKAIPLDRIKEKTSNIQTHFLQNNSFQKSMKKQGQRNDKIMQNHIQDTFRQIDKQSPLKNSFALDYDQKPIIVNRNQNKSNEFQTNLKNGNNIGQQDNANKKLKPYQKNDQYAKAFQTRALLVRTPPQK